MPKMLSWEPKEIRRRVKKKKKPKKYYKKKRKIAVPLEVKKLRKKIKKRRIINRRVTNKKSCHVKFNRRKILIICAGVSNRLPLARAAALAGISHKTVYQWMAQGKDPMAHPSHYIFRKRVKRIQAQIEQESLDIIRAAQKGGAKIVDTSISFGSKGTEIRRRTKTLAPSWGAAAWFLERRYRDHYGKDAVSEQERTPEDFAQEIRQVAKELFDSVPLFPPDDNDKEEEVKEDVKGE